MPKAALQDFMITSIGYKSIFSLPGGGLERVRRELKNFNAYAVLQFCSKLALVLSSKGQTDIESQAYIIKTVFSKELQSRFIGSLRKSGNPPWTVFNEKSVLLLAKETLLNSPQRGGEEITKDNVEKLGILLLVLNDECIGQGWEDRKITYPVYIERERIREFLAKATFFHGAWYMPNQLGAYRKIFVQAIEIAKNQGIDLEKTFSKAAFGLTLTEHYSIGLSVLTNWTKNLAKHPKLEEEWIICQNKYFRKTILSKGKIEAFFRANSVDVSNFKRLNQELIDNALHGEDAPSHNFLAFKQRPFIYYNKDCYVCPAPRFLSDRITEGVYWIVENYLRNNEPKIHERWPEIWGDAYEHYINETFREIWGSKYLSNYQDEKETERVDGVIIDEKLATLAEIKYAHWRHKTMVTGTKKNMVQDIQHFIKGGEKPKGLGQLSKNIRDLIEGKWAIQELGKTSKPILPLLIVGETLPMDAFNRKLYEEIAKAEKISFAPEICLSFVILELEDITILETIAQKYGRDKALEVLKRYSVLYTSRNEIGYVQNSVCFKNFAHSQGGIEIGKNVNLWNEFEQLFNEVKAVVFGIKKE